MPGPPVQDGDYGVLKARLLDGLRPLVGEVDGVYLSLHGAMMSQSVQDAEGEILNEVRALFGERVPIAASFDLHTHFTTAMAEATPLVSGFQTCPHIDMYQTGVRAMRLLISALGIADQQVEHRAILLDGKHIPNS